MYVGRDFGQGLKDGRIAGRENSGGGSVWSQCLVLPTSFPTCLILGLNVNFLLHAYWDAITENT